MKTSYKIDMCTFSIVLFNLYVFCNLTLVLAPPGSILRNMGNNCLVFLS